MADTEFKVSLLPWQQEVWNSSARFPVIAAGRRSGKSQLAAYKLIFKALTCPRRTGKVFYVAPTQGQARDIMWDLLIDTAGDLVASTHRNDMHVTLVNGVTIALKGCDRPDTMRGVSLWFVVLDEYADMKPAVWETILRPALSDLEGDAMFIGTPAGRNHFYELYKDAELGNDSEYAAFHFTSYDNPFIKRSEIEKAKGQLSSHNFRQEYMASFEALGSALFEESWIVYDDEEPEQADTYVAVDVAGFKDAMKKQTKNTRLDETAIVVVKANKDGWWVEDIIHGRWTLDKTAEQIFNVVKKYRPTAMGIEKGLAQQAVMSPLQDMMRRTNFFFNIKMLTHGNQKKTDRIMWALQGRFEHGLIRLNPGDWNAVFLDQLFQFPSPLTHDDLIDALAYIDQLVIETYDDADDFLLDDEDEYAYAQGY